MSKDNPDWGWWKSEAKRRGKRAGTRARKGAKEAARRTRYSADYTSWQARNQYAAHRVRSLEACAKALGFDPARTPQPGGETIQTAKRHWQQTAAQKPNLAKYNPKYGSLPAVGHAEHEIREEGFSDIVSTGRERSPNGPVLTFEAKRLAFQGQYAGLWSIFKLTVGRVAGSDRLHVKVYRM